MQLWLEWIRPAASTRLYAGSSPASCSTADRTKWLPSPVFQAGHLSGSRPESATNFDVECNVVRSDTLNVVLTDSNSVYVTK